MKRITQVTIILLLAAIITACGGETVPTLVPTAVPVDEVVEETTAGPTDTPAPEPTATLESAQVPEGTSPLDTMGLVVDPALIDVTWAWVQRTDNGGANVLITVPEPGNYTLFFNGDTTFNAKIDCNNAGSAYATDGKGNIFMELGAMTQAACPPESLAEDMINMFGPAQSYVYEDNGETVIFKWAAGGPLGLLPKNEPGSGTI